MKIKLVSLVLATLKEFFRNKKSIVLLIIFPLLLVSIIFSSFNSEGLNKLSVGFINRAGPNYESLIDDYFSSFLKITHYTDENACFNDLKNYYQYACINLVPSQGSLILTVNYDNTREFIIWELIGRIKDAVDHIQKVKSKEMASDFLESLNVNMNKLTSFKGELTNSISSIETYIGELDSFILKLTKVKTDLSNQIVSLNSDIQELRELHDELNQVKRELYISLRTDLIYVKNDLNYISNLNNLTTYDESVIDSAVNRVEDLEDEFDDFSSDFDSYLMDFDSTIDDYEDQKDQIAVFVNDLNREINQLKQTKSDLEYYKSRLIETRDEFSQIERDFGLVSDIDADQLISPIKQRNTPVYVPNSNSLSDDSGSSADLANMVKGLNLLSLQTIFPTILFLIVLFLSLLISNFITLHNINSSSNVRRLMVRRLFFPNLFSVFLSSHIIILFPTIAVLALGDYFFKLPILENVLSISVIMIALSSIFIFLGMTLSFIIKKESITMLVTTFVLVLLMFFSGFLLPLERMSPLAYSFASVFPGNLILSTFNRIVFYNRSVWLFQYELIILSIWLVGMFLITVLTNFLHNHSK